MKGVGCFREVPSRSYFSSYFLHLSAVTFVRPVICPAVHRAPLSSLLCLLHLPVLIPISFYQLSHHSASILSSPWLQLFFFLFTLSLSLSALLSLLYCLFHHATVFLRSSSTLIFISFIHSYPAVDYHKRIEEGACLSVCLCKFPK